MAFSTHASPIQKNEPLMIATTIGIGKKPPIKLVDIKTTIGRPHDQKNGSGRAAWSLEAALGTASISSLNWRTLYIAIGAINAAITSFGFQDCTAALAVIKPLTGVCWHFVC